MSLITMHQIAHSLLDQLDNKQSILEKMACLFSPIEEKIELFHVVDDMQYIVNIERNGWLNKLLSGSAVRISVKAVKFNKQTII